MEWLCELSWSQAAKKKVKRLGDSDDEKDLSFQKKEEEDWKTHRTRTSGLVRRVCNKTQTTIIHGYSCRQDVEGHGMVMEDPSVLAFAALRAVFSPRSSSWWRIRSARGMRAPTRQDGICGVITTGARRAGYGGGKMGREERGEAEEKEGMGEKKADGKRTARKG